MGLVPRRGCEAGASREFGGARTRAGACTEHAETEKCSPKASMWCPTGPPKLKYYSYYAIIILCQEKRLLIQSSRK
jgi:hypothetical protein